MGGGGGFVDDVSLAEEFLFCGDEDGFCADSWWEVCLEGAPEVGGGNGCLALPCGGLSHGGDGFAGGKDGEEEEGCQDEKGCFGGIHGDCIGDVRDWAVVVGGIGVCVGEFA